MPTFTYITMHSLNHNQTIAAHIKTNNMFASFSKKLASVAVFLWNSGGSEGNTASLKTMLY